MTNPSRLTVWAGQRERGSRVLLRVMVWISLRLSQGLGECLLWPITAWFFLASPAARRASRAWLGRVLGRPARAGDVARHFLAFARAILDRVFFLAGRVDRYETEVEGLSHLLAPIEAGRGCVLLGAHLGSFDAMRALGRRAPVPVRPAMYRANAGALTALLERLDPELAAGIIDIGRPEAMLQVREALSRGELVAFLADRATDPRRLEAVPFFGEPAPFPAGPFQIALMLQAPLVMFLGLRLDRRRYRLCFEPLPAPDTADRREALRQVMTAYVSRLEAACRRYPLQWFNFYDFWRPAIVEPDGNGRGAERRGAPKIPGPRPVATPSGVRIPCPDKARPRPSSPSAMGGSAKKDFRPHGMGRRDPGGAKPCLGDRGDQEPRRFLWNAWRASRAAMKRPFAILFPAPSAAPDLRDLPGKALPCPRQGGRRDKGKTLATRKARAFPPTGTRHLSWMLAPLLCAMAWAAAHAAEPVAGLPETIARLLAARPAHQTTFREEKTLPRLTRPLIGTGILAWRPPDHLEKRTLAPVPESFVIEGRRATVTGADNATHALDVDAHAELRVLVNTLVGVLSGDLGLLRREFDVTAEGAAASWRLTLTPRGPDAMKVLRNAQVTGAEGAVREIRLMLPDGNWDVLTVDGG